MLLHAEAKADLSRAYSTVSSMLSNSRAYPIHSLTITSTCTAAAYLRCEMLLNFFDTMQLQAPDVTVA